MERQKAAPTRWILSGAVAIGLLVAASRVAMAVKEWFVGDPVNSPTISEPFDGEKVGMGAAIVCACNAITDSDDWTEGCESGSKEDVSAEPLWTDGGSGGFWYDGRDCETPTIYMTPHETGNVTLKVEFDDWATTQYDDYCYGPGFSDSVTIEVVNAKMIFKVGGDETSQITRGGSGTFEVVDGGGDVIPGATYAGWFFDGEDEVDASDPANTTRTWSGTIVESGIASCSVTFGGITATVSKLITVNARDGWSIAPTCIQDNEPLWGFPDMYPGDQPFGRNRDKEENDAKIIWPRGDDFQDGYTTAQVATGPNKGIWYISASTFAIDRETCINYFIKPNQTGFPDPPNVGWYEYNDGEGVDVDGFKTAVERHEAYGSAANPKGHQKFLEDEEAKPDRDAKAAIEDKVAETEAALKTATKSEVHTIDTAIIEAAAVEPSGHWIGGLWYYDFQFEYWSWWNVLQ